MLALARGTDQFPVRRVRDLDLAESTMKRVRILAICAVVALASTAAMAFDVQLGAKQSGQPAQQAAPTESGGLGADMSLSESTTGAAGGTEVRIPGLGRLGVLPKMDFGLELLYGATDPKQQAEPQTPAANPADDLVVRGTVKHRF